MKRVITYNLSDNFIENIADFLNKNFLSNGDDLSRVLCVFGGKRPALFLRRELAHQIKKPFFPPAIVSIDEFIDSIVEPVNHFSKINELDASHLIYTLAQKHMPKILETRKSFSEFLPWATEVLSFIEQLDLEDVADSNLKSIEKSAEIGYDIPQSINHILEQIVKLRSEYHKTLIKANKLSRGMKYLEASKLVGKNNFNDFDEVIFCNFFYLHSTERKIFKDVYDKGKGVFVFSGSQDKWSVLGELSRELKIEIKPDTEDTQVPSFSLYQGFDKHSEISLVGECLSKIKNKDKTLIVMPKPEMIVPMVSEMATTLNEFNVSLGYPLNRTPLYVLLDGLFKAQENMRGSRYYTRDYLDVIRHPFVKNMRTAQRIGVSRVLVHKLEEVIKGEINSAIAGSLFLTLSEIEAESDIYRDAASTLANMDIDITAQECKGALEELNGLFFRKWEDATSFSKFSDALEGLLDALIEKSDILKFPFNSKAIEFLHLIIDEFRVLSFKDDAFLQSEIWDIFKKRIDKGVVSFSGSPLRGTQVLGLLESRSLSFENVIICDVNESVLPKLKIYEPLIPREVMLSLGLNRLEKEEEIQRYQFLRLISSAKHTDIIYIDNDLSEKSRFIEELLWEQQKQTKKIEAVSIPKATYTLESFQPKNKIKKTNGMLDFLNQCTYSASRINTYLSCPLQFYYQYVLGLRESDDFLGDLQATHVGTFIHELLEDAFKIFIGKKPLIDNKFKKYFSKVLDEKFEKEIERRMRGDSLLLKGIIETRMNKFLDEESQRSVEKILCLEKQFKAKLKVGSKIFDFRYTADRVDDCGDNKLLIIDYKTGGSNIAPKSLAGLKKMEMNIESIRESLRSFQLPLYYRFITEEFPGFDANACLYNIRSTEQKMFISQDDYEFRDEILNISFKALEFVFDQILDPKVPFSPNKDERRCQYCPFTSLCS